MARTSPVSQLEKIRAARIKLEKEEQRLMSRGHDKALAQIVQIAHSAGLSAADITAALGGKAKGKKSLPKQLVPRRLRPNAQLQAKKWPPNTAILPTQPIHGLAVVACPSGCKLYIPPALWPPLKSKLPNNLDIPCQPPCVHNGGGFLLLLTINLAVHSLCSVL